MEFRNPKKIWQDPSQEIVTFGRGFCIGVFIIGSVLQWNAADWQWSWSAFVKNSHVSFPWWLVGCSILTLTTAVPWLMRPIYFLWMLLGQTMGWIVNRILLSIIFYLIFTPVGLLYRRWCKVITKHADTNITTYWEEKQTGKNNKSYYRQF